MKKLMILMGFVSFAVTVNAQTSLQTTKKAGIEENLKKLHDELDKKVKPDPAQETVIYNAFKTYYSKEEQIKKINPIASQAKPVDMEALEKLAKERDETVKVILTKSQFRKYKRAVENLESQANGDMEDMDRNGPPPPPNGEMGGPPPDF